MRVQASQLNLTIGDLAGNTARVLQALERARAARVEIVLFSELTLTGYPPEDLVLDHSFIEAAEQQLRRIAPFTKDLFVVLGLPRKNPKTQVKPLYNSAAVFIDGELVGFKNKTLLPTYDVFDEARLFEPGEAVGIFTFKNRKIAITICEDAWQHSGNVGFANYAVDPIQALASQGVSLLLNLSASPYAYDRFSTRLAVFQAAAMTLACPVVMCNQVGANDQLIFDGYSFCINGQGELVGQAPGFVEADLVVDLDALGAPVQMTRNLTEDLYQALVLGIRDYFHKQGFSRALLGLSGGIDSALVAALSCAALGASNVMAFGLPTRFSSSSSHTDAALLAKNLGISLQMLSIDALFQTTLDLVAPHLRGPALPITEENLQSRIRGLLLMALSNQWGSLLLNTGNKSEMAMGYTTLYGDMCGGLGVLLDVSKLRVYELARFINREVEVIPRSILEKAPSAELRPNQKDADTLPPYEILDPIIADSVEEGMSPKEIGIKRGCEVAFVEGIVRKIHAAEYKRRQSPIGLRVTKKSFSKGRVVPIVQAWR